MPAFYLEIMKFLIGDQVVVISGKDRGKTGVLTRFSKSKDRVVVEGVNKCIRHVKGRDRSPGQRVEFFAPIHISNVAIVDPETKKSSRMGYKISKTGAKKRISKKSGKEVVSPKKAKTVVKA